MCVYVQALVCVYVCLCACAFVHVSVCMYEYACGFHWHTGTSLHVCVLESFIKLCHSPATKSSCKLSAKELHISQVYTHT